MISKTKYIRLVLGSCFVIFLCSTCIENYWPDFYPKYINALVVDGVITNDPGPYEIRLSTSAGVNYPQYLPLDGCKVSIVDDRGNSETLKGFENGIYRTSEDGIRGVSGNSYQLKIISPDGNSYESEFEKMPIPTEIDKIYWEIEFHPHPVLERDITGFRFFIDTYTSEIGENYYLWDLESTYKFNANYRIKYYFDGQMHAFSPSDSLYTCYLTRKIPEIFTYSTANLTEPRITKFPLNLVTTETKELSIRYSLLVNQLSITKKAYQFWHKIKSIDDEQGELHSRQPFQVRGNVRNIENSSEVVLGYFMVSGISNKRIFMDRPSGVDWHYPDSCNLRPIDQNNLYINIENWPLFFPAVYFGPAQSPAWVDYQWCVDCTKLDGLLETPEFWHD